MAVVGASAIALAVLGLVVGEQRAGPLDVEMRPVVVEATAAGTYLARPDSTVLGLCPEPPCDPHTSIDLRVRGLPPAPYEARLEGPTTVPLGPLSADGGEMVLRWSEGRDHTDKDRLVLSLAGRAVASIPVGGGGTTDLGGPLAVSWGAAPARVHLNEIGGVTTSTVATARLAEAAPEGWAFHARLEGTAGPIDLGPLDAGDGVGAVLDARIERVRLEDQDRVVVLLAPVDGRGGFPVLEARV